MICCEPNFFDNFNEDTELHTIHNAISSKLEATQDSLKKAHAESLYSVPTTPELIVNILLTLGYAGISFGAMYSYSQYAKKGFNKLFHRDVEGVEQLLEVCGVLPGMMLSMRSGVRTVINLWNNKGDLITLGIVRRWNHHESRIEFVLDIIGEAVFLLGPAIAACSSAYASYKVLKPLENNLPLGLPLEYFIRTAQFSSFSTNAYLTKVMGADEFSNLFAQYVLHDKTKLQRSVILTILNNYSSEIKKHRNTSDHNFKRILVKHFEELHALNDPTKPGQFLLKIGKQIKFWFKYFCTEDKLNQMSLHDNARQPIFEKKTLITAIFAGFYTLPSYMSGIQAADFAKQLFKFGALDLSFLAPPGWLIGSCSFGINTLINTRAINNLINNCVSLYEEVRGGYKSQWTAVDYARIAFSIFIDAFYIFGQVGLAVIFPAFSNEALYGLQIAATIVSAAGLGVFSLNNTLSALKEYLQTWWWRGVLNENPLQYFDDNISTQDTLFDICGRELVELTTLEVKQIQQLPTATMEAIYSIIENCFKDINIAEARASAVSVQQEANYSDTENFFQFSQTTYGPMFSRRNDLTMLLKKANDDASNDANVVNSKASCCYLSR